MKRFVIVGAKRVVKINSKKLLNGRLLLFRPQRDFAIAAGLPHPNTAVSSSVAKLSTVGLEAVGVTFGLYLSFLCLATLTLWCPMTTSSLVPVPLSLTSSLRFLHFCFVFPSVVNRIYAFCF